MLIKNKLKSIKFIKYFYENVLNKSIKNVFLDNFQKRCLLSYSVFPFKQKEKMFIHPNFVENYTLAETLRKNGYIVDVYNNTYNGKIDYSKYDLIVGEGNPISNYFKNKAKKSTFVIYYATGSHPLINNLNSQKALSNFYRKTGLYVPNSARIVSDNWKLSACLSDRFIVLGNDVTKKTFEVFVNSDFIKTLNPPYYSTNVISDFSRKDKRKFLWFGSYGLVHKDLNTVIDVFLEHSEYELHICGRFDEEFEFNSYYNQKISNAKNIILHGYVDVNSENFKNLMEECAFTILSSCAEGCSTGVVTVMGNGGLIPLISKECGLDIKNGFYIETANANSILSALKKTESFTSDEIAKFSKNNIQFISENFSIDAFKKNVDEILTNFLESKND